MLGGAGGPDSLLTYSMGENGAGAEFSDFCGAQSRQRWNVELPQEFDARGSWRA